MATLVTIVLTSPLKKCVIFCTYISLVCKQTQAFLIFAVTVLGHTRMVSLNRILKLCFITLPKNVDHCKTHFFDPPPFIPNLNVLPVSCRLSSSGRGLLNDLHAYDIASVTWTDLSAAVSGASPSARARHGFVSARNKLFVHGGDDSTGDYACLGAGAKECQARVTHESFQSQCVVRENSYLT